MKSFKLIVMAAMLAVSTSAFAQFTNKSSSTAASAGSLDGWSSVWMEYNPSTFDYDDGDDSFTGLSLGYSKAFNIVPGKPFFLEAGLGLQYSFYSEEIEDYGDYEAKFSMFSAKIPVNFIYKFDIPNSSVSLLPYVGLNLRYNFSAKEKDEEIDGKWEKEYDFFDKKDMDGEEYTWNRFQIGWNLGVKARFGQNFQVGLGYGEDFSEIAKKVKIHTTTISVGYTF